MTVGTFQGGANETRPAVACVVPYPRPKGKSAATFCAEMCLMNRAAMNSSFHPLVTRYTDDKFDRDQN